MNCKPGQWARITGGLEHNLNKVVRVVGPHPVAKGYANPDGSTVQCPIWQVDPPIVGSDGRFYNAVPDEHLVPLFQLST